MSIASRSAAPHTVTAPSEALRLFVGRSDLVRLFAGFLNEGPKEKILFFSGPGGNGKSLLLRHLRAECCKQLSWRRWDEVKNAPVDEFASFFRAYPVHSDPTAATDVSARAVPSVFIDFGTPQDGDDRPQEAFSSLLRIRQLLAGFNFKTPRYVYGSLMYLHKTGGLSPSAGKALFPPEESALASGLIGTILAVVPHMAAFSAAVGLAGSALNVIDRHMGHSLKLRWTARKLKDEIARIDALDPFDLRDQLPELLAQDLSIAMHEEGAPPRLVFFFDTHEAFWGTRPYETDTPYFQADEWFRRFLSNLEMSAGIVVVIAGREKPRWASAEPDKFPIREEDLELCPIGSLAKPEALDYLGKAGVPPDLHQSLLSYASEDDSYRRAGVNPFYLGLLVDVVNAYRQSGQAPSAADFVHIPELSRKTEALVNRLLRNGDREVESAVYSLGACRSFDEATYEYLGREMRFVTSDAGFRWLTGLSFVSSTNTRSPSFRMHDLLRKLFREQRDPRTTKANQALESHYRGLAAGGSTVHAASAIYHANWRDWEAGCLEWIDAFDWAIEDDNIPLCESLLGVQNELIVKDPSMTARMEGISGEYSLNHSALSPAVGRFERALQLLGDATGQAADRSRGPALWKLGYAYQRIDGRASALDMVDQGLLILDRVLERDPTEVSALLEKVTALRVKANMLQRSNNIVDSEKALRAGAAIAELVPRDSCYSERALTARADALVDLAELFWASNPTTSHRFVEEVILLVDGAIQRAGIGRKHRLTPLYNVLARAHDLRARGNKQNGELEAALRGFRQAETLYAESAKLRPGDHFVSQYRIGVLQAINDCLSALGRNDDMVSSLRIESAAIKRLSETLADDDANQEKFVTLFALAERLRLLGHTEDAVTAYRQTIRACDELLRDGLSGESISATRYGACFHAADLLRAQGSYEAALELYRQCGDAWNPPRTSEDSVAAAACLSYMAACQSSLGLAQDALESIRSSATIFEEQFPTLPEGQLWMVFIKVALLCAKRELDAGFAAETVARLTRLMYTFLRTGTPVGWSCLVVIVDRALEPFIEAHAALGTLLDGVSVFRELITLLGGPLPAEVDEALRWDTQLSVMAGLNRSFSRLKDRPAEIDSQYQTAELCEKMIQLGRETPHLDQYLINSGGVHHDLGALLLSDVRLAESLAALQRAISSFDELAARRPLTSYEETMRATSLLLHRLAEWKQSPSSAGLDRMGEQEVALRQLEQKYAGDAEVTSRIADCYWTIGVVFELHPSSWGWAEFSYLRAYLRYETVHDQGRAASVQAQVEKFRHRASEEALAMFGASERSLIAPVETSSFDQRWSGFIEALETAVRALSSADRISEAQQVCARAIATIQTVGPPGELLEGRTWSDLAELQIMSSDSAGAIASLRNSVSALRPLAERNSSDPSSLRHLADSLRYLACLLAVGPEPADAVELLQESIASYTRVLTLAPDTHCTLALAAASFILASLDSGAAEDSAVAVARAEFERLIELHAAEPIGALTGLTWRVVGEMHEKTARREAAMSHYRSAISAFQSFLSSEPGDGFIRRELDRATALVETLTVG